MNAYRKINIHHVSARCILLLLFSIFLNACGAPTRTHFPDHNAMNQSLAIPVKNFITATNNHDTKAYLAQFTSDADITDWGHHYQGAKGLLDWNTTDNIGVNATMKVISVNAIERDGLSGQAVQINVKSDKFNGCGLIQFYLEGNLIRRIVIEP